MKKIPVVLFTFQDHSADTDGIAHPRYFTAVGFVLEETKEGYLVGHWLDAEDPTTRAEINQVTSYIAKVVGLKKKIIAYVKK